MASLDVDEVDGYSIGENPRSSAFSSLPEISNILQAKEPTIDRLRELFKFSSNGPLACPSECFTEVLIIARECET